MIPLEKLSEPLFTVGKKFAELTEAMDGAAGFNSGEHGASHHHILYFQHQHWSPASFTLAYDYRKAGDSIFILHDPIFYDVHV